METTKSIAVMLALVVLTATTVHSAQEPPKPVTSVTPAAEISNTRTASCLVKITADPAILPLNMQTIDSLFDSSGVRGKAIHEVLGIPPDQDPGELFEIEQLSFDPLGGIPVLGGIPLLGRIPLGPSRTRQTEIDEEAGYEEMMMDRGSTAPAGEPRSSRQPSTSTAGPSAARSPAPAMPGASMTRIRSTTAPTSARRPRGSYDSYYRSDRRSDRSPYDGYYYYGRTRSRTPRSRIGAAGTSTTAADQTLLFRLSVDLPEGVKPAAKEFMSALIDNFKEALGEAHDARQEQIEDEIHLAEEWREEAEEQLSELRHELGEIRSTPAIGHDPADYAVYEQLDQIVDLSVLTPSMPFSEAIEEMKNSVEPPLKIVVLWRDLLDEAEIEPATEINMDGVPAVALGKALELLLKAVSSGAADELGYAVDKGIITIAAAESLPRRLETWIYDIPALAHTAAGDGDLVQLIQETVEPESWYETGGEGTIRMYMGKKLAIRQTREVHLKIDKLLAELLQAVTVSASADVPANISVGMLLERKHSLLRDKQTLELDLARLEARRSAIEEQVPLIYEEVGTKIHQDTIISELQRLLELQIQLRERTEELVKRGQVSHAEFADAEGKVTRAKIELAKRREELSKSAGGDQLAKFANELTTLTIEVTEKKAELQVLGKQLDQTQKQLTAISTSDPQVSKIRFVTQALEMAERRVNELEARLANLQIPTVTVLGAD